MSYFDYYPSDYEPDFDEEEEAEILKEILNDPTIDWDKEYRDSIDYKPGDKIEWMDEYDDEIEVEGSDCSGEGDEEDGDENESDHVGDGPDEAGSDASTGDEEGRVYVNSWDDETLFDQNLPKGKMDEQRSEDEVPPGPGADSGEPAGTFQLSTSSFQSY